MRHIDCAEWIYFNPKGEWTEELITRYTENWFGKSVEIDLDNAMVHEEYSYVQHRSNWGRLKKSIFE